MKKKLLILAALPAVALSALAANPKVQGNLRMFYTGTVTTAWNSGPTSSGAAFAIELKWASGSQKPAAKWSIDNNPNRWDIGTKVTGITCTNHTIKFFPPGGNTGPANFDVNGTGQDDKTYVVTVNYQ